MKKKESYHHAPDFAAPAHSFGAHRLLCSRPVEYLLVFLIGAFTYYGMEMLWRGYSHITMFFAGGICFVIIYSCEKRLSRLKLFYRCLLYAMAITVVEFVFGVVFNLVLHLGVWDYSHHAFNLLGQVCPLFFGLWMLVSLPAVFLARAIRHAFGTARGQIA